jgi:copper(I)-binding protein
VKAEPVTVRRLGVGLAVAAALVTSACAAGQQAATANEQSTIDGANASVGTINLRAAVLEAPSGNTAFWPAGSDVALKVVIVNNGTKPDRLVSVTSPAFSDWGAYATTQQADRVVNAHAAAAASTSAPASSSSPAESSSAGAPASGSATGSATESASPTATRTAKPKPLPSALQNITITPGSRLGWGTPESTGALLLIHATQVLYPATTIQLTFTFQNAGTVTFAVPVSQSAAANTSIIPAPSTSVIER